MFCLISAFGVIYLVQKKGGIDDGRNYAMKTIHGGPNKGKSVSKQKNVQNELNVSASISCIEYSKYCIIHLSAFFP